MLRLLNNNAANIDLQHVGQQPFNLQELRSDAASPTIDLKAEPLRQQPGARRRPFWTRDWSLLSPPGLFAVAATIDLATVMDRLGDTPDVAVDLEIHVSDGAVGVGLMDRHGAYLPAAETIVEGSRDTRLVTLRAVRTRTPAAVVFRNLRADGRSQFLVKSATLRAAD